MEVCPKCGTALWIDRSYTAVEGDNSPDTPTKVYTCLEQLCPNPQCSNYKQVVDVIRHEEPISR